MDFISLFLNILRENGSLWNVILLYFVLIKTIFYKFTPLKCVPCKA